MTDVRLTATNPEDSSVVPVACNAKGELLLEEAPAFDGNIDGDLTVSGAASVDRNVSAYWFEANEPNPDGLGSASFLGKLNGVETSRISANGNLTVSGSGEFAGAVNSTSFVADRSGDNTSYLGTVDASNSNKEAGFHTTDGVNKSWIYTDGSATFAGNVQAESLNTGGSATFAGNVQAGGAAGATAGNYGFIGFSNAPGPLTANDGRETYATVYARNLDSGLAYVWKGADEIADITSWIRNNGDCYFEGSATFAGDVVVGSRNKQWMLVEQGGLCHMVEQVAGTADLLSPTPAESQYPELRDVFAELNIVEKALEEVMVKLRMQVPAGWPVWDGSSKNS